MGFCGKKEGKGKEWQAKKKLKDPVVLYAPIERQQHEAIRRLAFKTRRSIADLARDALKLYIVGQQEQR